MPGKRGPSKIHLAVENTMRTKGLAKGTRVKLPMGHLKVACHARGRASRLRQNCSWETEAVTCDYCRETKYFLEASNES